MLLLKLFVGVLQLLQANAWKVQGLGHDWFFPNSYCSTKYRTPHNWTQFNSNIYSIFKYTTKKVKQSHYRPQEAKRVPGGWGSQISRQSTHEGGQVVSPTHQAPLPPTKYSWDSFLLEAESTTGATVQPEGLCQWRIPVTSLGNEPATFQQKAHLSNKKLPKNIY